MNRSIRALMLSAVACLAFGSACKIALAEDVTLKVTEWHTMEEQFDAPFRKIVADFESKNPGIKIDVVGIPWMDTLNTLIVRTSGGEAPDVALLSDNWIPTLASMGALAPLQSLTPKETLAEMEWAHTSLIDPVTDAKGNLNALPWYVFGFALVYDKELLAKAGIDAPPTKISELETDIDKVAKLGGRVFGYGSNFTGSAGAGEQFYRWLWAYGGNVLTPDGKVAFDGPEGVAALSALAKLEHNAKNAVTLGIDNYAAREVFAKGNAGFIEEAAWIRPILRNLSGEGEAFDSKWGVVPWPTSNVTGSAAPLVSGHYWAIFKQCKHPQEAMKFVNFMLSNRQHQEEWARIFGSNPVFKSQQDLELFKTDSYYGAFSKALATGHTLPMHPQESVIATNIAGAVQEALAGGDPATALKKAGDSTRRILGQ
jgi:multiple sugar transport system substrate-binding protein